MMSPLRIRPAAGFQASDAGVTIGAVVANTGDVSLAGVIVEALVQGQTVADAAVDLDPGKEDLVELLVPRRFVADTSGSEPSYTGDFLLTATCEEAHAHWPPTSALVERAGSQDSLKKL